MKGLFPLIILFLVAACDPHGFGYKNNPVAILEKIHESIERNDVQQFLDYTSREAMCVYGNEAGLKNLRENLPEKTPIKTKATKLTATAFTSPKFVREYWSYYREDYEVDILHKKENTLLASVRVVCDFGLDGSRDDKLLFAAVAKYKRRECRVVKFTPVSFAPLPVASDCEVLKVL